MNNQKIADIYAGNNKIREKFTETLSALTDVQASALPDGEKWTVAQIAEHVSIVEENMAKICLKLLSKAQADGKTSTGTAFISDSFRARGAEVAQIKLEAPEMVHPSGGKSIAESLAKMAETQAKFNELLPLFETCDCDENKFPHPFFGDLSAAEWLTLAGGHKARHLKQIRNVLAKSGQ
ncbi:MAG: DinB family protein [Saprospiraceae bacterium]|nr:DinB family protein [Pyrinomonadaceae bacterium]